MVCILPKYDDLRDEWDAALCEQIARQAAGGISDNDGHKNPPK